MILLPIQQCGKPTKTLLPQQYAIEHKLISSNSNEKKKRCIMISKENNCWDTQSRVLIWLCPIMLNARSPDIPTSLRPARERMLLHCDNNDGQHSAAARPTQKTTWQQTKRRVRARNDVKWQQKRVGWKLKDCLWVIAWWLTALQPLTRKMLSRTTLFRDVTLVNLFYAYIYNIRCEDVVWAILESWYCCSLYGSGKWTSGTQMNCLNI